MAVKQQEYELRRRIASARYEVSMDALVLLLQLEVENVKQRFRSCAKDEVDALQAEWKTYEKVLKWITEPLPEHKAS